MKIKINSITEIEVEQIKIVAKVFVGGKEVSGHLNKTLDVAIINQLPSDLVGSMSAFAFGEDFSVDELLSLLKETYPDIDFEKEKSLIDDGILDSVAMVTLISVIEDRFDISVTMEYIQPSYFQSAENMWEMIEELM